MGINYRTKCGVVKSTAKYFGCYSLQKPNVDMSGGELDMMVNYTNKSFCGICVYITLFKYFEDIFVWQTDCDKIIKTKNEKQLVDECANKLFHLGRLDRHH